jgi:hypothetical protein
MSRSNAHGIPGTASALEASLSVIREILDDFSAPTAHAETLTGGKSLTSPYLGIRLLIPTRF